MADQTPGGHDFDPLGDRLRATFQAEHDELERRRSTSGLGAARGRSLRWVPFAAAAAVIALAGFFFISSGDGGDTAVDLGVAAQPTPAPSPEPTAADTPAEPIETVRAVPGSGTRIEPGTDLCRPGEYDPDRTVIWNAKGRPVTPLQLPAAPPASEFTRELVPGTEVELAGGCVQIPGPTGEMEWYELVAPNGQTDWVLSLSLVSPTTYRQLNRPPSSVQPTVNGCGEPLFVAPFRFIWGIAADDPDGGLVAHTEVGVDAPVTRIIERNEIVVVTGQCELSSTGSQWRELRTADGSVEWVSGRYLAEPVGGCLVDPEAPEAAALPGLAVFDGDQVAFAAVPEIRYQLFPAARVEPIPCGPAVGIVPCPVTGPFFVWDVASDDPDGGLLTHTIADVDAPVVRTLLYDQADIAATGSCTRSTSGSWWWELAHPDGTDWASGNFLAHPVIACLTDGADQPGRKAEPLVTGWGLGGDGGIAFAAFGSSSYDWFAGESVLLGQPCDTDSGSDSLATVPCSRTSSQQPTAGSSTPVAEDTWFAGADESTADHVHDLRTESNSTCTRIVVAFGEEANENDRAASSLPPIKVTYESGSLTISPSRGGWETAFGDAHRVDFNGGIGLLTLSPGYLFSVELMYADKDPFVRVLNDPARVVIDLFPADGGGASPEPFGDRFVLREPIQQNTTGAGLPVDNDIVVAGFGRPFEAQGQYRIWSVPEDVDPVSFLAEPPEADFAGLFLTSGWAEAWGKFFVELPDLAPGSYIAVFGELPPTDEIGFYGTGQLFRIADPANEDSGPWPEAVLLPNVQLPPES